MLPTTQTVNELQAKATETLVAHYPNWQWSGTCRCGYGYGFDPTDTGHSTPPGSCTPSPRRTKHDADQTRPAAEVAGTGNSARARITGLAPVVGAQVAALGAELEALLGEPLDGVGDRGAHGGSL